VGDLAAGIALPFVVVRAEVLIVVPGTDSSLWQAFGWVLPTATRALALPRQRAIGGQIVMSADPGDLHLILTRH
jgi:hypothetical protein